MNRWDELIFSASKNQLETLCFQAFRHQYENTAVYRQYCMLLGKEPAKISRLQDIPFLPVSFFKSQKILEKGMDAAQVFASSSTTSAVPSKHYVADLALYERSFLQSFHLFYGAVEDYAILSLLPSYLERSGSSLVYMAKELMARSGKKESRFFLHDYEQLQQELRSLRARKQKTILLGVTFALLDFAQSFPVYFPELILMETGGMKGRGKELIRREVHEQLAQSFGVSHIHSEYGMTELLSQAYSQGNGIYHAPPWMRVLIRDPYDPLTVSTQAGKGAINIIDLANIHSCSFLATDDLGTLHNNGTFEIMGRLDQAEIRGCNLMLA